MPIDENDEFTPEFFATRARQRALNNIGDQVADGMKSADALHRLAEAVEDEAKADWKSRETAKKKNIKGECPDKY